MRVGIGYCLLHLLNHYKRKTAEAFVLTGSYGKVSGNNFGNITMVYGQRFPFNLVGGNTVTISNYVAYTLMRYYEGNNTGVIDIYY